VLSVRLSLYRFSKHLPPALQRLLHEAPTTAHQHVENVEEQRLRFGAVMLQEVKGDSSVFIQGDDLAVYEGAGREPFAGLGRPSVNGSPRGSDKRRREITGGRRDSQSLARDLSQRQRSEPCVVRRGKRTVRSRYGNRRKLTAMFSAPKMVL
jgi:hypothetical protein